LRNDVTDEFHVSNFPGSAFFQNQSDMFFGIPANNENVNRWNTLVSPIDPKNSKYVSGWTDPWKKPISSNHVSSWDAIETSWRKKPL